MVASVVVLGLAGCGSYEPFDPPVAGEIPPGPGLFSGPSGEFVIFRGGGTVEPPPDETETKGSVKEGVLPADTANRPDRAP